MQTNLDCSQGNGIPDLVVLRLPGGYCDNPYVTYIIIQLDKCHSSALAVPYSYTLHSWLAYVPALLVEII
jgi:hypothetical protein